MEDRYSRPAKELSHKTSILKGSIRSLLMPLCCWALSTAPSMVHAQKDFPHDTAYYETYPDKLTARIYLSQKYVHLHFRPSDGGSQLEYEANPKLNLGVGVTMHNLSLNLFFGPSFLNKNDAKGKTTGIDIQLHVYPKKWAIDLLGVFPKGYHLDPKGYAAASSNSYYYRPDVHLSLLGLSVYRVPNKEKFSYRAAIVQTEWQKKSAGSLLYGGEVYYGTVKGDSAFVPASVQNRFPQSGINNINFFRVGPGIGYAYTLVIATHFFITGSLIGNLDLSFTTEKGAGKNNAFTVSPSSVYKAALGYNSSSWNVSANLTGNALWIKSASSPKNYYWPSGNYRLVVAKKFALKKHHQS